MPSKVQGVPVAPLTGVLDTRSSPDDIPANGLRMRMNFQTVGQNKLRRGRGWQKLLSKSPYNNQDFHDQLLLYSGIRQPVTMLFEAVTTRQLLKLLLATQGKIAVLNEYAGNWQILGSGYGGSQSTSAAAPRFLCDQLGDTVVFTNNFDKPKYYLLESTPDDAGVLVHDIPDLELIGLTRAALVWQWRNCVFLADVTMDNERFPNRLLWSNFNDPLAFDPAQLDSITASKDLHRHERILGGGPFGNSFLIYTTHGIWEMAVVGGEESFAFRRLYNGEENEEQGTLFYPNTLVVRKEGHIYLAQDGIYEFNQYAANPQRVEWMHRSSNLLFDDIDEANCTVHVGTNNGDEVMFFTAKKGDINQCPSVGVRYNMAYQAADKIDHGFTAFSKYHSQPIATVRDFIIQNRICTLDGLRTAGYPYVKEGLPNPLPAPDAAFTPVAIYTATPQTIAGTITVENWTRPNPDANSLCALLAGETLDDICKSCKGPALLIGACSVDWCLKEFAEVFYRERCTNPSAVGTNSVNGYTSATGAYALDEIVGLLRFATLWSEGMMVQINDVRLDFLDVPQNVPAEIQLSVGISAQVKDPNQQECGIVWHAHSRREIKCMSNRTQTDHLRKNSAPSAYVHWPIERKGKRLYVELRMDGIGGDSLFSRIVAQVQTSKIKHF